VHPKFLLSWLLPQVVPSQLQCILIKVGEILLGKCAMQRVGGRVIMSGSIKGSCAGRCCAVLFKRFILGEPVIGIPGAKS